MTITQRMRGKIIIKAAGETKKAGTEVVVGKVEKGIKVEEEVDLLIALTV